MTLFGAMQAVVCEAARVEAPESLTVARGTASRAPGQGPAALGSRTEEFASVIRRLRMESVAG